MSERTADGFAAKDTLLAATLLAVGGYALGNIALVLIAGLLNIGGVEVLGDPLRAQIVGTIAIQGVAFIGGSLLFLAVTDRWELLRVHLPSARDLALVVVGYGLLTGSFYAFNVVYEALGISAAESGVVAAGMENPTLLLLLVPLSLLLVGPGEELFYRGIVQGWLRESFGPVAAVLTASVLFASIHVPGLVGSSATSVVATLAIITFLAVYLGALYEYTGNLVVPALVHGLYNATQFLLAYGQATGGL